MCNNGKIRDSKSLTFGYLQVAIEMIVVTKGLIARDVKALLIKHYERKSCTNTVFADDHSRSKIDRVDRHVVRRANSRDSREVLTPFSYLISAAPLLEP